jgi:hypothetical protein
MLPEMVPRRWLTRSIRPKRARLLGIEMLDVYCGSANRRRDGVEECTETSVHRERLLKYEALISPCRTEHATETGGYWPASGGQ